MNFYHGTNKKNGDTIEGPPPQVDITLGGGEMGQGFYVGDNLTLAISWAKARYKNPAVLEFEIDKKKYAKLAFRQLDHRQVLNTWQQLKRLGTHRKHNFGFDVVFGPLATSPYAGQYKFESSTGQHLLNNSRITRIL